MALCATINFSSCSNDDDPTEGVTEGLVNETLPTQKGGQDLLKTVSAPIPLAVIQNILLITHSLSMKEAAMMPYST